MVNSVVRVRVPASTANVGPGFDALGMALGLYAWIEMFELDEASESIVELIGDELGGLPTDESNLIIRCAQEIYDHAGVTRKPLSVRIISEIPLTRGLGSSATAIIGGMVAANALLGNPLDDQEIFRLSTMREQHPDNVGAALFGGFIVATWDGGDSLPQLVQLAVPETLDVLVAIPQFELSTEKARAALPVSYSRSDAVFNLSRTAMIVAAFASGKIEHLADAMRDRIHQPYRASMIPGLQAVLDGAAQHGAVGAALSGAGPTMLAFVDSTIKGSGEQLEHWIVETLGNVGIQAEMMWLKPCMQGAFAESYTNQNQPDQTIEQLAETSKQKRVLGA